MSFGQQLELTAGEGFREESLPGFLRWWAWSGRGLHALDATLMFPHPLPLPATACCVFGGSDRAGEGRSFGGALNLGSARWAPSPGSGSRPFQGCSPARGYRDEMWFIARGFKPHMTQPERYAVARRQSLKGISTLARGCHLWWLPRVHAPTAIQS